MINSRTELQKQMFLKNTLPIIFQRKAVRCVCVCVCVNSSFTEGTNFTDCLTKVSSLNHQATLVEITKEPIRQK